MVRMSSFPTLSTARLQLREMQEHDSAQYSSLLTDSAESYFITDSPISPELVATKIQHNRLAFDQGRAVYWSITRQDDFVGFVALHDPMSEGPALSYAITKAWRRQGIASEALSVVIDFVFAQLDAASILASTHVENLASANLLLSLRFRDEGVVHLEGRGPRRRFRLPRP